MSYEELAESITITARASRNGTRMPWEDVAFVCIYAAIDAIRMAGARREPDVSTRIIRMLDGIIEITTGA